MFFTVFIKLSTWVHYLICRFKLLYLLFVTPGVFLGPRIIGRKEMKTFWIGFSQCLGSRCCILSLSYDLLCCCFHILLALQRSLLSYVNQCSLLFLLINFQKDNVANQREHLILLLANVHLRQLPKPEQQPKVCRLLKYYGK